MRCESDQKQIVMCVLLFPHHSCDFNLKCQIFLLNENQPEGRYSLLLIDVFYSFHIHIDTTFCSVA